ncbi:MAG: hypothetical protein ABIF09_14340 [Gemmatimonadota bacterium]
MEMVMREVASSQDKEARHERERAISKAFEFVVRDPDFEHGEELSGQLSIEAKNFIVQMYEKLRDRKLSTGPGIGGADSRAIKRPGKPTGGGEDGEEQ